MIANTCSSPRQIAQTEIGFVPSEEFEQSTAAKLILVAPPIPAARRKVAATRNEFGSYLGDFCRLPLLSAEEETYYFRRMNFLKWRAETARQTLNPSRPSIRKIRQIASDLELAKQDFQHIVEHNLRLVIPLARKAESLGLPVWDGISEGNAAMMRAVNGFDYSRGFRFSTYATWAIKRSLMTCAQRYHRDQRRFPATELAMMAEQPDSRESVTAETLRHQADATLVDELLKKLDKRTRNILSMRFGLGKDKAPMRLKDVGAKFGVSKERVRQIEVAAMKTLRKLAEAEGVESAFQSS